jgi:anti-anti-sigma factor
VITVAGEFDVVAAPVVKARFEVFDVCHAPRLVVDVARSSFCDCAGLSALLHAHRRALVGDGWLRLCATSPRLRKMIAMTGLASTLRFIRPLPMHSPMLNEVPPIEESRNAHDGTYDPSARNP